MRSLPLPPARRTKGGTDALFHGSPPYVMDPEGEYPAGILENYSRCPPNLSRGHFVKSSNQSPEAFKLPKHVFWEKKVLPSLAAHPQADPTFSSFAAFNAYHPTNVEGLVYFLLDADQPWTPANTWISHHGIPFHKYKGRLWSLESLATEFNIEPAILRCLLYRFPDPVQALAYRSGTPIPELPPSDPQNAPFLLRPVVRATKTASQLGAWHWNSMSRGAYYLESEGIWPLLEQRIESQGHLAVEDFRELAGTRFANNPSRVLSAKYVDYLHVCALTGLGHFAALDPRDPQSLGLVRDYDHPTAATAIEDIVMARVRYACNENGIQAELGGSFSSIKSSHSWATEEALHRLYAPFLGYEAFHTILRSLVSRGILADYLPEDESLDPLYVTPAFLAQEPDPKDCRNAAQAWRARLKAMERSAVPGTIHRRRDPESGEDCITPWEPGFDTSLLDTVRGTQLDLTPNKTPYIYPGA